ncbi:OmpA family protein [Streptomyces sp. NPDC005251]|uniref:OmpA family protein n=1 Tax=Streptomyces sp. NPDC005251 TaxID=3157166 RepID=UPI0033B264BE
MVASYRFGKGAAALTPTDKASVADFVNKWRMSGANVTVRVDGYASADGSPTRNLELSCKRAQTVVDALTTPTQQGLAGVPSLYIEMYGHVGSNTGYALLADPRATISATLPPAPVTPVGGPDISQELRAAVAKTRAMFAAWGGPRKNLACEALLSLFIALRAWDIKDLHNQDWIKGYKQCATTVGRASCERTVTVDKACSYAGSVNYVIYGVMNRLCADHLTAYPPMGPRFGFSPDPWGFDWTPQMSAADFSEASMLARIDKYKSESKNVGPSKAWATAGYRGWPAAPSPPGDRPECSPTCPTPYNGPEFAVYWEPTTF